ncbi:AAA family ATPase [Nonlabens mediterrranea]|uniref:AAA family ATPase n=1 Tax=Nonlabens mediterrranea TaxID=1419947 RepID=A0ABS0A3H9_9FLAO|nr:AAA family ATPase [Nonlabens mediterrranea]
MLFDQVTAQHIKQGIKDYEEKGFPKGFGPSSTYDVLYEGKLFPPKAIMAYANYHATGRALENYFKGGPNEDCFKALKRNGFEIVAKQKKDLYNWTQTHLELASYLKDKRSNTSELIELLKESGVKVMQDQSQPGISIPLEEMDPFTFICHIYKYGEKKRLDIIQKIAKKLGLFIPDGERGIPSANAQKVWMFPYQHERVGNEFDILWELFEATINDTITDDLFQRALNIRNVGKTKLTEVLFYVRPFDYFPLNGPSRPFIKEELSVSPDFNSYEEYMAINKAIKSKSDIPFPQLSYKSWNYTNNRSDISKDEQDLLKIAVKFSKNELTDYFAGLDQFLTDFDFSIDDEKIAFNVRPEGLRFIVGQRAVLDLDLHGDNGKIQVISDKDFFPITHKYKGNDGAIMVGSNSYDDLKPHWEHVSSQVGKEYTSAIKSSYKRFQNHAFAKAVFDKEYRKQILNRIDDSIARESDSNYNKTLTTMTKSPLNQIFYGPPGTGKTYHTILEAAKIITHNESINYKHALEVFNRELGKRIEFITFHQNYSYEDFIQGLRPDTEVSGQLSFDKKDGVFKRIADKALKNIKDSENPSAAKKEFEVVFSEFINPLVEGELAELEVQMKKTSLYITEVGEKSIEFRKNQGDSKHSLSIATLKKMYDNGSNDIISGGLQHYYNPILELLLEKGKSNVVAVKRQNYVIIIDEINRANISRVFGELITLIEKDKRSHGKIPLTATLPSGDSFMVPSNLYIIGTMNTADKSIALLDIALRRRFQFIPMYPDSSSTSDKVVHDAIIMDTINKEIIARKGHDFTIGHSYFMGDDYELKDTIDNKVLPLLLEYFMNDYDEVKRILAAANLKVDGWPMQLVEND